MPIYEYQCSACGQDFERLLRRADQKPGPCPACGKDRLAKKWSSFSVNMATPAPAGCDACPREAGCPMSGRGCPSSNPQSFS